MKKTLICLFVAVSSLSVAQDNTLPNTGNVGIGTLNPTARLDVNGNMKIDSCLHIKDSLLIEDNARIMQDMRVEGETTLLGDTKIDGELTLTNVSYDDTFLGRLLFADANGKVNGGTPNDLGTIIYSKQCAPDPYGDVLLPVWNNGLNKIYIDCPPVRVGIGTSTPRTKLDVHGNTYTNRLAIGIHPDSLIGELHIRSVNPSGPDYPIMVVQSYSQGAERRVFQLNSDGLLRSREIKIDAHTWADYVFQDDYVLMPILEVEAFINANGHLPEMPSEEEVLENGINLAEMNRLLLEKIEELTLHIIEQEKRISELESK